MNDLILKEVIVEQNNNSPYGEFNQLPEEGCKYQLYLNIPKAEVPEGTTITAKEIKNNGEITGLELTIVNPNSTPQVFNIPYGTNGKDGKDGINGSILSIGKDGYWYIDNKNTGVIARGKDGTQIDSTQVSYGISDSTETQPKEWEDSLPTGDLQGKTIWQKIQFLGSKDFLPLYIPVYQGKDGINGETPESTSGHNYIHDNTDKGLFMAWNSSLGMKANYPIKPNAPTGVDRLMFRTNVNKDTITDDEDTYYSPNLEFFYPPLYNENKICEEYLNKKVAMMWGAIEDGGELLESYGFSINTPFNSRTAFTAKKWEVQLGYKDEESNGDLLKLKLLTPAAEIKIGSSKEEIKNSTGIKEVITLRNDNDDILRIHSVHTSEDEINKIADKVQDSTIKANLKESTFSSRTVQGISNILNADTDIEILEGTNYIGEFPECSIGQEEDIYIGRAIFEKEETDIQGNKLGTYIREAVPYFRFRSDFKTPYQYKYGYPKHDSKILITDSRGVVGQATKEEIFDFLELGSVDKPLIYQTTRTNVNSYQPEVVNSTQLVKLEHSLVAGAFSLQENNAVSIIKDATNQDAIKFNFIGIYKIEVSFNLQITDYDDSKSLDEFIKEFKYPEIGLKKEGETTYSSKSSILNVLQEQREQNLENSNQCTAILYHKVDLGTLQNLYNFNFSTKFLWEEAFTVTSPFHLKSSPKTPIYVTITKIN